MRVEVLGGVERRRRWSRDDKMRIIEEAPALAMVSLGEIPRIV
jgi:transposase